MDGHGGWCGEAADNGVTTSATKAELLVARRLLLQSNAPACPQCGGSHQMQLVDWLNDRGARGCRPCGCFCLHEPVMAARSPFFAGTGDGAAGA